MLKEHTISGLVKNQPGVLFKIAKVFGEANINIKSLVVGETEDESLSRMTIVVKAPENLIKKVEDKLQHIMYVKKIDDLSAGEFLARELVLIKVASGKTDSLKIMQIAEIFHAEVVGVGKETLTLEMTGDEEKTKGFIQLLKPFGIKSLARTGRIAIKRNDED